VNRSSPGEITLAGVALIVVAAYTALVGSTDSQETLAAVGIFAAVLFVAGVVWPCVTIAGIEVDASAPSDATAGEIVPITLRVRGRASRLELRVLDPAGEWRRCGAPGEGEILHLAARRGVFRYARVELRTAAPLGVFQRHRVVVAALRRPIAVGPRPTREPPVLGPLPGDDAPVSLPVVSPVGDAVRAVRPYVPGDPARVVSICAVSPTTSRPPRRVRPASPARRSRRAGGSCSRRSSTTASSSPVCATAARQADGSRPRSPACRRCRPKAGP
jgi:uncharacterized protein (DUF58 family)